MTTELTGPTITTQPTTTTPLNMTIYNLREFRFCCQDDKTWLKPDKVARLRGVSLSHLQVCDEKIHCPMTETNPGGEDEDDCMEGWFERGGQIDAGLRMWGWTSGPARLVLRHAHSVLQVHHWLGRRWSGVRQGHRLGRLPR